MSEFKAKSDEIYGLSERVNSKIGTLDDIIESLVNKLNSLEWRPKEFAMQYDHLYNSIESLKKLKWRLEELSEDVIRFSENIKELDAKKYNDFLQDKLSSGYFGDSDLSKIFNNVVDSFDDFNVEGGKLEKVDYQFEGMSDEEKIIAASKDLKLSMLLVDEYYDNIMKSGIYDDMCDQLDLHMKFMNEYDILKDMTIEEEYIKFSIARSMGLQYDLDGDFKNKQFGTSENSDKIMYLELIRNKLIKDGDFEKCVKIDQLMNQLLILGSAAGASKTLIEMPPKIFKELVDSVINDVTDIEKWGDTVDYLIQGNYYEGDIAFQGIIAQCALGFTGFDAPFDIRDLYYDATHFEPTKKWAIQTGLDGLCLLPVVAMFRKAKNVDKIDEVAGLAKRLDDVQMNKANASIKAYKNIIESLKTDFKFVSDNVKKVIDTGKGYICVMKNNSVLVLSNARLQTAGVEGFLLNRFKNFCFDGEILVKIEGGYKKIKDIEIGDYVYSQNVTTKEKLYKKVLDKYVGETKEFVILHVGNEKIRVTKPHRFYMSDGIWKAAEDIVGGDEILDVDGTGRVVDEVEIELLDEKELVYNFNVEDFHTYFVTESGLFTHNAYEPPKNLDDINNLKYTGGRSKKEIESLMYDPAKKKITEGSKEETSICLELEEKGNFGKIERSPDPKTEFIDIKDGKKIEVKSFESYPIGADGRKITAPRKGAFKLENAMKNIKKELKENGNDILVINKTKLEKNHLEELENAVEESEFKNKIIWWPE